MHIRRHVSSKRAIVRIPTNTFRDRALAKLFFLLLESYALQLLKAFCVKPLKLGIRVELL